MSDETEKLRTTLDELQAELARLEQDDPEVRALLQTALADIQRTLEGAGEEATNGGAAEDDAASTTEESIADRLGSAASHYEETHPNVSGTIGGLIDALSRMGI